MSLEIPPSPKCPLVGDAHRHDHLRQEERSSWTCKPWDDDSETRRTVTSSSLDSMMLLGHSGTDHRPRRVYNTPTLSPISSPRKDIDRNSKFNPRRVCSIDASGDGGDDTRSVGTASLSSSREGVELYVPDLFQEESPSGGQSATHSSKQGQQLQHQRTLMMMNKLSNSLSEFRRSNPDRLRGNGTPHNRMPHNTSHGEKTSNRHYHHRDLLDIPLSIDIVTPSPQRSSQWERTASIVGGVLQDSNNSFNLDDLLEEEDGDQPEHNNCFLLSTQHTPTRGEEKSRSHHHRPPSRGTLHRSMASYVDNARLNASMPILSSPQLLRGSVGCGYSAAGEDATIPSNDGSVSASERELLELALHGSMQSFYDDADEMDHHPMHQRDNDYCCDAEGNADEGNLSQSVGGSSRAPLSRRSTLSARSSGRLQRIPARRIASINVTLDSTTAPSSAESHPFFHTPTSKSSSGADTATSASIDTIPRATGRSSHNHHQHRNKVVPIKSSSSTRMTDFLSRSHCSERG